MNLQPQASDPANQSGAKSNSTWKRVFWGLLALLALGIALAFLPLENWWNSVSGAIDRLGPWGPIAYVAIYVVATVFFIPGSAITLGAGLLFGFGWGLLWVIVGSNLGANVAFLVGRYLARDAVAARIAGHPRFETIDRAVENEGWKIVALTRLSPVFPFNLLNYAFGLTRIKWLHYAVATLFGMLPGTIVYVYLGWIGATVAETGSGAASVLATVTKIVGLLATIAVTFLVTRIARRALKEKTGIE